MNKKPKEIKPKSFEEHFGSFMVYIFFAALVLLCVIWLIERIAPLITPFVVLLAIFAVFVYPFIKIKEWIKNRR